jgi:hypothetical protein
MHFTPCTFPKRWNGLPDRGPKSCSCGPGEDTSTWARTPQHVTGMHERTSVLWSVSICKLKMALQRPLLRDIASDVVPFRVETMLQLRLPMRTDALHRETMCILSLRDFFCSGNTHSVERTQPHSSAKTGLGHTGWGSGRAQQCLDHRMGLKTTPNVK